MVRKAVYQALLSVYREEGFLMDTLGVWKKRDQPSDRDFRLAFEIAMGTVRRTWTLDAIGKQLSKTGKLTLKLKEKVLVRMAIYQAVFMKSPIYAVGDQMVKLAKQVCHPRFAAFLNALIHKLDGFTWAPSDDLSERYSYPPFFIDQLVKDYGQDKAESSLDAMNHTHPTMVRIRPGKSDDHKIVYQSNMGNVVKLIDEAPSDYGDKDWLYIQNVTSVYLLDQLMTNLSTKPLRILDVCAAPGGKTLALHDAFPESELYVNEKSQKRLATLEENLNKYGVNAKLSSEDGTTFHSSKHFDLIILDVPCSNSGVLGKKPEARLRQTKEHIQQLVDLQKALVRHAKHLLKKDGQLWYLTCSILKCENEQVVHDSDMDMVGDPITILPNAEGWDGGFAAALKLKRDK